MNTLHEQQLAAVVGGAPALPDGGLQLPEVPNQQAIEDFLTWWYFHELRLLQ